MQDMTRVSGTKEIEDLRAIYLDMLAFRKKYPEKESKPMSLDAAALKLEPEFVVFLAKEGFEVDAVNKQGKTALLHAAEEGRTEMVEALVKECGANVRIADDRGQTALHHLPFEDTTRLLLDAGADAGAKDCNGNTPLHNAEDHESVRMLVAAGADPEQRNRKGHTPLHEAARGNMTAVVEALLDAGADIEAKNHKGETPLLLAVRYSMADAADVLCRRGADMNVEANVPSKALRGQGLLFEAVVMKNEHKGIFDTIDVLFKHGLDPRGRDQDGDSPADYIRLLGFTGCADRIEARSKALDDKDHAASMMERAKARGIQTSRGREVSL